MVRFDLFRGDDVAGAMTGGMQSKGLSHFVGHELLLKPIALAPAEIARRAIGYAEQVVREGPSDAVEIAGPAPDERIKLQREAAPAGDLLRMQSTRSSAGGD